MAKWTLDDGTVLRLKLSRDIDGSVEIFVNAAGKKDQQYWVGRFATDGVLSLSSSLNIAIPAQGLQFKKDGSLKTIRGRD